MQLYELEIANLQMNSFKEPPPGHKMSYLINDSNDSRAEG